MAHPLFSKSTIEPRAACPPKLSDLHHALSQASSLTDQDSAETIITSTFNLYNSIYSLQKEDSQFLTKELSLEQIKTELSKIPETIRQAIETETTSNEMKETIEKFEKRERERIQLAIKYLQLIEELKSE